MVEELRLRVEELEGREDTVPVEPGEIAFVDATQVEQFQPDKHFAQVGVVDGEQAVRLLHSGGSLGQELVGGDADADRDGVAALLLDLRLALIWRAISCIVRFLRAGQLSKPKAGLIFL